MANELELFRGLQQDQDARHTDAADASTANVYYTIVVAIVVITGAMMLMICVMMRKIGILRSRMVTCKADWEYMRQKMEILSVEIEALKEIQNQQTANNLPNDVELLSVMINEVKQHLECWGEKLKEMEKTNGIHFQKVIQECDKQRQHISVLRDVNSNIHKQFNDLVEKTDNHFVCVGMGISEEVKYTTDNRCPFYIDTNITHLMLNDNPINGKVGLGNIQSKIKHLVLSKILKHTRLQQFDITILMNFSFKLDEDACLVENLYYYRDRPQYIEIFQTAVKSILDKHIYILMPPDKEYSRNIITMCPLLAKHDYVREI